ANTNKLFSLSGESRLVNISNIDKVKEHSWKDKIGHLPIGKAALREQLMPGLFIPVLPDSKKIGKPDYLHSNVVTNEQIGLIKDNYKNVIKNRTLSEKGIKSLISNPHGTYVYESAIISEEIYNKFKEYRKAPIERKNEILSEVRKLYDLDQNLKINLIVNEPALLDKSPYLLEAKDKYNREELLKDYTNGKYTDKGLSNSPKLNTNVFPYER
ncbi:hypothetical protein, partial [Leptotrichia sp. OH3620_COT-345]|uniref:hypothetical protein n=1 Tax=Leptotrichia sp. OH3620_COT-345 TaxID=2491048 RepID=UPI0013157676